MTDYRNPLGDEIDTRHVLARMLADQQAEERWPIRALRGIASYLPTDDRESNQRGPDEDWASWWMRTGQDSGGATFLSGALKGALNTSANWLAGKPEVGPDTLAPFGAAAMGIPFTRAAASFRHGPGLPSSWTDFYMSRAGDNPVVRDHLRSLLDRSWDDAAFGSALEQARNQLSPDDFNTLSAAYGGPRHGDRPDPFQSARLDLVREIEKKKITDEGGPSVSFAADSSRSSLPGLLANSGEQGRPRIDNPIRAYHGSPHDFNEFDLSKIGTGEGAQAYGHGLYFAENPAVAHDYRKALTSGRMHWDYAVDGSQIPMGSIRWEAADLLNRYSPAEALREARTPEIQTAIQELAGKKIEKVERGKTYEVNLHARPEQFLDWDKPLIQQSPAVLEAIQKVAPRTDSQLAQPFTHQDPKWVDSLLSSGVSPLAEHGVPGVRYLDYGSRSPVTREKTSNYVVWTPEIIEILRKYGLLGPALLGPALANTLAGDQEQ